MSWDTAETHAAFADKHQLPYPLVSDRSGKIAAAYGVQRLGGWLPSKRVTFVIGSDGIVHHVIHSEFNIDRHIDEAIEALRRLQGQR